MAKGSCLWGIQHWRELLSQSEVILEPLKDGIALISGFFPAVPLRPAWVRTLSLFRNDTSENVSGMMSGPTSLPIPLAVGDLQSSCVAISLLSPLRRVLRFVYCELDRFSIAFLDA
jgi:hypothetical protein